MPRTLRHFYRGASAFVWLWFSLTSASAAERFPGGTVALRDLVSSTDSLAAHDLVFDWTFAREAVEYLRSPRPDLSERMAGSPAVAHLLRHARNFDYDVPKDSGRELIGALLGPADTQAERSTTCVESLAYFSGPMLTDPRWVNDVLRYLPNDFRFRGALFLTFGYDIGVAFGPTASLNCTHSHFKDHPRELLYYAIHELHHTAFMSYQKPPRLADIQSCADLLHLVEYSTHMEGMAVLAAYPRRRDDGALADDADYAALEDPKRMADDLARYFEDYNKLKSRAAQPADAEARQILERMSGGERLWYRVGAYIARRIEKYQGRAKLVELVKQGPARFMATYEVVERNTNK